MPSSAFQTTDWYDAPHYYDIVFDEDTREEADFLEQVRARFVATSGLALLEPACGSGRLLCELARRGYDTVGFDLSPAMVTYARERLEAAGLRARIGAGRLESFRYRRRFDLAHCLVSTFKYLTDEASARAHLECVAAALRRGGVYVLGLHLSDYSVDTRLRERWIGQRRGTRVVCNIQSWPPDRRRRIERVRSRMTVEERGATKRFETEWDFRTYDARQLRRLLRSVPALEHVATFDFTYDIEAPRALNDGQLDCLLILRRV